MQTSCKQIWNKDMIAENLQYTFHFGKGVIITTVIMIRGFLWPNLKCLQCKPSGRIRVCCSDIHTGHHIITPWRGPCLELVGHIQMRVSKPFPATSQACGGCCKILILNVLHNKRRPCLHFYCLLEVFHHTQEFFTHVETSPLPVKSYKLWPMMGSDGHRTVRVL